MKKRMKYGDFDLEKVTWGYRDIFRETIERLYDENLLSNYDDAATVTFFSLMQRVDESPGFDHILKKFMDALNPEQAWIMRIPELFQDWTEIGRRFAECKSYMGMNYFEIWAKGGFGETPQELAYAVDKAKYLLTIDAEFAHSFVKSFKKLRKHLSLNEIETFVAYALQLHARSPRNSCSFLELKTKTSREYLRLVSCEVRLSEIEGRLARFGRAIADSAMVLDNLSKLDSDELYLRGSSVVCLGQSLYLPEKVVGKRPAHENLEYYFLTIALAALSLRGNGFSRIHGSSGITVLSDYLEIQSGGAGNWPLTVLVTYFETYRILWRLRDELPGLEPILRRYSRAELKHRTALSDTANLISAMLRECGRIKRSKPEKKALQELKKYLPEINSLDESIDAAIALRSNKQGWESLADFIPQVLPPLSFFPDYFYPAEESSTYPGEAIINLKHAELRQQNPKDNDDDEKSESEAEAGIGDSGNNGGNENKIKTKIGYFYDEWNEQERDYFENWVCLHEKKMLKTGKNEQLKQEYQIYAQQVRRIFERLQPDLVRKEKYLQEGDNINIDILHDCLSLRKANIYDNIKFYEKPFIKKRDIAVSLLIDMSGSTRENAGRKRKIIELERDAAFILAEGLDKIGDQFGIFGFTGTGRENAEYFVFKDFEDKWDDTTQQQLLAATARSSTRMGVALRHTGFKLEQQAVSRKLIIIITDGKPMDAEYDPNNGYAQHDVRRANEENRAHGINTFCISTEDNLSADLELMFPPRRFIILRTMAELPQLLSQFYLKLTNL